MKKTYDQVRDEKIKKIKRFLFYVVVNNDKVDRMPFRSVLSYVLNTFKLGLVSKKDYAYLYRYFYKLRKKRRKLIEEKRMSEDILLLLHKKLQNDEISYGYAKKVLDLVRPYLSSAKYSEWNKVFSALKNDDND